MKRFLIWVINFYQRHISPALPPTCRFRPTCSQYAKEAIEVHGAIFGSYLAIRRILRCHPFSKGGFDPVPEKGRRRSKSAGTDQEIRAEPSALTVRERFAKTTEEERTRGIVVNGGNVR